MQPHLYLETSPTLHPKDAPAVSRTFTDLRENAAGFATAFMVGMIEWTCIEAIHDHFGSGADSVGTHIDMSRLAATPAGAKVTVTAKLIAMNGRKLLFKVTCRDEFDLIGEGVHERALVTLADSPAHRAAA